MSRAIEGAEEVATVAGDRETGPLSQRSEAFRWFARGVGFTLGLLVVVVVAIGAVLAVRALVLVFAAILLASALEPMIGGLRGRLPLGRTASVLLVYVGFFAIVAGIALLVVPAAVVQANQLAQESPALLQRAHDWASNLRPQPLAQGVTGLVESAQATLSRSKSPSADTVVRAGLTVGQAAVALGTLLAIVFFWLTEHARLQRYALSFVPRERRAGVRNAWNEVETRLGLWVRGELVLMATMAVMTGVVYTIIGLPTPLLLAVWAGFAEAIPLVGPLLGAVPAVVLAATVRPELVLLTLVIYGGLQFFEGNILVPVVMRNAIGISPFLVIVSLTIGAELGGIPGAFLAVPVTAALEVILDRLQARDVPVAQEPGGPVPGAQTPGAEERAAQAARESPDADLGPDGSERDRPTAPGPKPVGGDGDDSESGKRALPDERRSAFARVAAMRLQARVGWLVRRREVDLPTLSRKGAARRRHIST